MYVFFEILKKKTSSMMLHVDVYMVCRAGKMEKHSACLNQIIAYYERNFIFFWLNVFEYVCVTFKVFPQPDIPYRHVVFRSCKWRWRTEVQSSLEMEISHVSGWRRPVSRVTSFTWTIWTGWPIFVWHALPSPLRSCFQTSPLIFAKYLSLDFYKGSLNNTNRAS